MKNIFVSSFLFALILLLLNSCVDDNDTSPGAFTMVKTFGGDSLDYAVQIMETDDDHYLILGRTNSFGLGKTDAYLVKVDPLGNKVWEENYGGSNFDDASQMVKTPDGGYMIVGSTLSFGYGGMDIMLIKTDENGKQQFFKTFGDTYYDKGKFIIPSGDGQFLIGGYTTLVSGNESDMILIKISSGGEEIWSKTYGFDSTDVANSALLLNDGYLVQGKSIVGEDNQNITLFKTDFDGVMQWSKQYGGEAVEELLDMKALEDGTFLACGYSGSFHNNRNNNAWVIQFDDEGNKLNENNYGSANEWDYEEGYAIIPAQTGGFYMSGRQRSSLWVTRLDNDLNQEWSETYGDVYYNNTRVGFDLLEEPDGKIVIVGGETDSQNGDIHMLRLDPQLAAED
ncbi:MAG: hypothetical protein ACQESX_05350 [Bacteroidota bacterium]